MAEDNKIPNGTPDFSKAVKGTRHGRTKVSKTDFEKLESRVAVLEQAFLAQEKGSPSASKTNRSKSTPKPKKDKEDTTGRKE